MKLILPNDVLLTGANEVEVHIDIGEMLGERVFAKQTVTVTGAVQGAKVTLSPATVDVRVKAPLSQLAWIKAARYPAVCGHNRAPQGEVYCAAAFQAAGRAVTGDVTANTTEWKSPSNGA